MTDTWNERVAGLAVFLSMSYVAFANPGILGQPSVDMPVMPVFLATCFMACVASYVSGRLGNAPAALAPGLALSAAIAQFLKYKDTTIKWESALLVCLVAGIILLLASVLTIGGKTLRRHIVDAIPQSIRLAVIGGIGALLAETALEFVREHHGPTFPKFGWFLAGLATIGSGYILLRALATFAAGSFPGFARGLDVAGRSSLFLSVLLVAWLARPWTTIPPSDDRLWIWLQTSRTLDEIVRSTLNVESLILLFFVLYILLADFVGSPYHMALDEKGYDPDNFDAADNKSIKRSFLIDSTANVMAPLVGTSPVVFYAENFAGRVVGGRTPTVAYVCAGGFLCLFLLGLGSHLFGTSIWVAVPKISVAPVLFFVGLMVIAKALWPRREEEPVALSDEEARLKAEHPLWIEFRDLGRRLPPAISVVVTPVTSFDVGVGFGILSFVLMHYILPPALRRQSLRNQVALVTFALVALGSLFLRAKYGLT